MTAPDWAPHRGSLRRGRDGEGDRRSAELCSRRSLARERLSLGLAVPPRFCFANPEIAAARRFVAYAKSARVLSIFDSNPVPSTVPRSDAPASDDRRALRATFGGIAIKSYVGVDAGGVLRSYSTSIWWVWKWPIGPPWKPYPSATIPSRRSNSHGSCLTGKTATYRAVSEAEKTYIGVMLDGSGAAAAVLETVELFKRLFDEVDASFTLVIEARYWREAYRRSFTRRGEFSPDMELWCERFRLVA
jgi:hypothetical protein